LSAKSICWLSLCLACFSCQMLRAQSWLTGYNYRKKISIDKSRFKGNTNLVDFPFLISITDPGLVNLQHCDPKINDLRGLDISFCLGSQPTVPIAFQLDSYDPTSGRLTCWVRLEQLFTGTNAGNNILYLYYGSNITTDPFEPRSASVWIRDYDRLWHMNADLAGKNLRSANGQTGKDAKGSSSIQQTDFLPGKIGTGVRFNGFSDAFFSSVDTNTTICITAWIKPKLTGKVQVVLGNDSLGGYQLSLDAAGYLVFEIMNGSRKITSSSISPLESGAWHHIAALFSKTQRKLFVNGTQVTGSAGSLSLIAGGQVRIGCSKTQDKWFEGEIDEVRIQNVLRSNDWINAEYLNQNEPELAYAISPEEKNPAQSSIAYEFTAAGGSQLWAEAANWKYGKVPPALSNVTVKANKVLRTSADMQINKLVLESGAMLCPEAELTIHCQTDIAPGAVISLALESQIRFKGDVINNGSIKGPGTLMLTGSQNLQTLTGNGSIAIANLMVNLPDKAHVALLQTEVQVSKYLKIIRGTLNVNGRLTLLADAQHAAAVWPISDLTNTALIGMANVQQYIAGSFVAPSTARGWKLLSVPVYHANQNNAYRYQIKDIQECVFITGPSGSVNGFDPSSNNSSTIYTHNQALPGTLSQKYVGIANTAVQIPVGRGIYLFSRGSRSMPDAYAKQIQGPVFINPEAYTLHYKGFLFSGEMMMTLESRNTGDPGDGFNLLGNPYAAPIVWSRLSKVNTGPFVWTFDPKNNAYQVTDDPNFLIPAGTGFFVRLNKGDANGSLTFTEQAKYIEAPSVKDAAKIQSILKQEPTALKRLSIQISKAELSDDYTVRYSASGNNQVTDADALKIGPGYLSISSITTDQQRLAIEDRAEIVNADTINLSIQAWTEGPCKFVFTGIADLDAKVTLVDHLLSIRREITDGNHIYNFNLNAGEVKGGEIRRFSILLKQQINTPENDLESETWSIYPNPFNDHIYINSKHTTIKRNKLLIRNIMGETIFSASTAPLIAGQSIEIKPGQLSDGVYILSVLDLDKGKITITRKLIKTTP